MNSSFDAHSGFSAALFLGKGKFTTTFNKCKMLPHWRHDGCERSEDADGAIKAAICRRPRAALRPMLALFVVCFFGALALISSAAVY
jgi:hypothetical protein